MAKIDHNLLFLYSENLRGKIKEMAFLLKKSPQRLKYNLRQFEKEGIVRNPHSIFDYSHFGLLLFRVYFKGGYIGDKDKAEIIKKLSENEHVVAIYELSGEFDLAIELISPNPSRFNKELKKVADIIPTLKNHKILLNVVTHIYPRAYLPNDKPLINHFLEEIVIGGDRAREEFTEYDMKVMKAVLENPKIRLSRLAKVSGMNVKTAASLLKELQNRKVLRAFKYWISANKLSIYKFRLFIKLHNISREREGQLLKFMLHTNEVVQVSKTIGNWNIEIDIESLSRTRIRELIAQIRSEFNDIIETFNLIEFYRLYMRKYLPEYVFGTSDKDNGQMKYNGQMK